MHAQEGDCGNWDYREHRLPAIGLVFLEVGSHISVICTLQRFAVRCVLVYCLTSVHVALCLDWNEGGINAIVPADIAPGDQHFVMGKLYSIVFSALEVQPMGPFVVSFWRNSSRHFTISQ